MNKPYLLTLLLLMLLLPIGSICYELARTAEPQPLVYYVGKWFTFWALGVRLLSAGIRQIAKPGFTAQEIFHLQSPDAAVIVKELGFANICIGLAAVLTLALPAWRPAAAFVGGLYMGIAGFYHLAKKPAGPNEVAAMVTDLLIFGLTGWYLSASLGL